MKRCLMFFWVQVFICIQGIAIPPHYYFKQISLKDGLSQSSVSCIEVDRQGVIWIGTHFGLNRFDRERIESYYQGKGNPNALPGNDLIFLTEDAECNLWVGTNNGLALYDRQRNHFIPMSYQSHQLMITSTLLTDDGVLFFGEGEIFKYTYSNRRLTVMPLRMKEKMNAQISGAYLYDKEKNIALLACRWGGLWLYNISDGKLERFSFIREREITSVCLSSDGNIWVSPYGEGIRCYNRKGRLLQRLVAPNALTNNVVLDCKEKNGELWIATDGGGINIYNLKTGFLRSIVHIPGDGHSLPVNSFSCLHCDNDNNIWAGSVRGGLLGMKEIFMNTYQEVIPGLAHGLSNRTVTGMYEDEEHTVWLGTDGGGLNSFNPVDDQFVHYPATYNTKVISVIGGSSPDVLILSLFSQGLYRFNKKDGSMSEYKIAGEEKLRMMFRYGISVHLLRLDPERFYLLADSVYLYNQISQELKVVTCREPDVVLSALQLVFTDGDCSYLRSASDLFELNHTNHTMRVIYHADDEVGIICAACKDKQGVIWIGSSNGLFRFGPEKLLEAVETEGFTDITSLAFDDSGRLWVGTHNGLFFYVPQDKRVVVFGESDGIYANEYLPKSPLVTSSGDIYMAGVSGLVRIPGKHTFTEEEEPAINLLDVIINGASVGYTVSGKKKQISIPWNYTSFSVKVIVKENDLMRRKLYRYYIKGNEEKVVESHNSTLTFHSFLPGDYRIFVSCNKKNGDWSNPVQLLSVTITPPWWKSTWFMILTAIVFIGFVGLALWLVIRAKEQKMAWKIKENERNTYEEKVRFLINVSHEIRTPLTLIYGPLKRILTSGELKEEPLLGQLTSIFRQTRRIRDMVNMVLDVRKMEIGRDTLNISEYPLNSWIKEVGDGFKPELEARGITLSYRLDPEIGDLPFDAAKCEVVLSNLLINALKFSGPDTGIRISTERIGAYVRISVADQGIGLGSVDISRLFTRFYQANHGQRGNGIGLAYSRLLVEMHGGRIEALSNPDKGATFYFELPQENKVESSIEPRPYMNELLGTPIEKGIVDTKKYTLLVVEDETELRKYLKNVLSEYFGQVLIASDGAEALDIISHRHPDLIVSDVMMPRMDGFELCRRVKETLEISHIPVVLLTARTDSESTVQGYKLGADVYIPKPFDLDLLLAVLRSQLHVRETVKLRYKDALLPVSPKEDTISNADEVFMQKLTGIINDNIAHPDLDVNFVTGRMAMSRASLYNKLKELADISIGDYINKLRMAKAVRLLADKNLSIQDVSEQCGFSQQRYFSTVFKLTYGTTPTRYRQEHFT